MHLAKPGKLKIGTNVKPSREAESSPSFDAAGLHGIFVILVYWLWEAL